MKKVIKIIIVLSAIFILPEAQAQWTQQSIPVSGTVYEILFINSTTGWMTLYNPLSLIKTTNAGNNWTVLSSGTTQFGKLRFFNDTLGYTVGSAGGSSILSRTTNGGLNWTILYTTGESLGEMSFPNPDTGWICGLGDLGKIWRTTNAGISFTEQLSSGSTSMDRIFFLKDRVNGEYTGWCSQAHILRKTTNSGLNWFTLPQSGIPGYNDLKFINKDTGWATGTSGQLTKIFRTTNGGYNWYIQSLPSGGTLTSNIVKFGVINNTLYGTGGDTIYSDARVFGVIWKSTNYGTTWGYQKPDTNSVQIGGYGIVSMIDSQTVWIANLDNSNHIAHTTNGGGPIIYTGINHNNTSTPVNFTLEQNYPNPFNPSTNITFSLKTNSIVSLGIFDITGKEILKIYNNDKLTIGNYISRLDFGKLNISSGVYFYKLEVSGINNNNNKLFSQTKKMIYSK